MPCQEILFFAYWSLVSISYIGNTCKNIIPAFLFVLLLKQFIKCSHIYLLFDSLFVSIFYLYIYFFTIYRNGLWSCDAKLYLIAFYLDSVISISSLMMIASSFFLDNASILLPLPFVKNIINRVSDSIILIICYKLDSLHSVSVDYDRSL